ncbi:roundabout homolog 4 [Porphyrio hochstetteri]
MAGGWATALGLGLCLTALRRGGCHPPATATAPQAGKDTPWGWCGWGGNPKTSRPCPNPWCPLPTAVLRDNFRLHPGDLVATAGQTLELDCVPPSGHPDPLVTWKKDGVTLDLTGDRHVVTNGKLRVAPARRSDSGLYVCVAANAAGERESRAARVSVLEKPTIVRRPGDAVVVAGSTVELGCGAQGDPAPRVQWHKERGDLPWGRHEVDREHTLRLSAVTLADAGTYVCTAQSQLGTAAASARLHVEDRLPPGRWDAAPQDLLAVQLHLDNGTMLPAAAVQLRWRMLIPAPAPEGYVVLYRCLLPASTSWVQHDAGRVLSTVIPALRRGYKYEFKVRPYAGGSQGLDSNSRHLWIPEEVPSAAPQHVTVGQAEMGNGTAVVSWEPPPPEAHNGIIRGYKVWSMSEDWQHPTNRTVDGATHHLETLLPGPGSQFCVQVAAFNGAGLGVPSNATCSTLGLVAGSSRVAQVLQQPAVIAAAGSLLWLALLALLLLLCQRRASQDAAARRRLVASDSPWLGGPWKPGCAPQNLSSSSSLSSRLLGSDGRDPHPSTLSLESPSLGPPTPPNRSSLRGGRPPPLGDSGCCGGGHPGVCTSPSTPTPSPWERICKRELQQVHSTPALMGAPGHVPTTGSGGEWGTDLGLAAGWPQPRGHEGDIATTVLAGGDPRRLPVFSSPKPRRGSTSLASGVTGSPVAPMRPPHAWHPPVTRSPATACPRDTSPGTRHPKNASLVTGIPRDTSLVTRNPRDTSPVTRSPRDVSPVTRSPRNMSLVTEHPKDMFLACRHLKDPAPGTRHQRDTISVTKHPEDMSLVTRCLRDMSPASRHGEEMSPVTSPHRNKLLGSPKDMSPTTRHPRDPSPGMKHQKDMPPATRHPRDTSPVTRPPEETSPATRYCRDTFLDTRYAKNMSPDIRHRRDMSPITRHAEEMSPATRHCQDTFLVTSRSPVDTSLAPRPPRDRSLLPGRLSPVLSDGVLTPQRVAEDLEMDQGTTCPSPPAPPTPRSFSPLHTYGYICGPPASELGEEEEEEEEGEEEEEEEQTATMGSPGGSLLNGWGSVSEDNLASARCSLVSSCDGSFLLDASFAQALAVAVDGLCCGLQDTDGGYGGPSPPSPSTLEGFLLPGVPIPTWSWGMALGVPQRAGVEADVGIPQHGGHRTGDSSPWARVGSEPGTGGTGPGGRARQGQSPLSSAKIQLY